MTPQANSYFENVWLWVAGKWGATMVEDDDIPLSSRLVQSASSLSLSNSSHNALMPFDIPANHNRLLTDHDLDNQTNAYAYENAAGIPLNIETQVNIYAGRGLLIKSKGPTWLWGTSVEHAKLYNYSLSTANNIFLGHMQTETPYYQLQVNVLVLAYLEGQGGFVNDPTFTDCNDNSNYIASWALRIINSTNLFIYSAGLYSFFDNQQLGYGNPQDY